MAGKGEHFPRHSLNLTPQPENPVISPADGKIVNTIDTSNFLLQANIFENILSACEIETLLQCRCVAERWNTFAKAELHKRTSINITLTRSICQDTYEYIEHLNLGKLPRSLPMKNQKKQTILKNLFQVVHQSPSFPVQNFKLSTSTLVKPGFQSLISNLGPVMKSLNLKCDFSQETRCSFLNSRFIPCLNNLLVNQAPNIESFTCFFYPPKSGRWQGSMNAYDCNSNLRFFNESGSGASDLSKMRFFSVKNCFSGKVFEEVLERAKNLQAVRVEAVEASTNKTMLGYFNETRQHKVKLLEHIHLCFDGIMINTYERLATLHGPFIQLKSINLKFCPEEITNKVYQNRCAFVLNSIFLSSSGTLRDMSTFPLRFLPKLKIPAMKNLKRFIFGNWVSGDGALSVADEHCYFFPKGFSIARNFCLKEISVVMKDPIGMSANFLRWLDITEAISSVERICVSDPELVPLEAREMTSKLFPNAVYACMEIL